MSQMRAAMDAGVNLQRFHQVRLESLHGASRGGKVWREYRGFFFRWEFHHSGSNIGIIEGACSVQGRTAVVFHRNIWTCTRNSSTGDEHQKIRVSCLLASRLLGWKTSEIEISIGKNSLPWISGTLFFFSLRNNATRDSKWNTFILVLVLHWPVKSQRFFSLLLVRTIFRGGVTFFTFNKTKFPDCVCGSVRRRISVAPAT